MKELFKDEALELYQQVGAKERLLIIIYKPIIEAYGWSSKLGRKAERAAMGTRKPFCHIYFRIEDYIGYAMSMPSVERGAQISTEGGLKHELSIDTHYLIGQILWISRNDFSQTLVNVSAKIGKNKPLIRSFAKVISLIDDFRSDLDDKYIKEHGVGKFPKSISPYYPRNNVSSGTEMIDLDLPISEIRRPEERKMIGTDLRTAKARKE